mmetsp:Transcript_15817/g.38019  ORF Transcript_15817/g.38019 Transcript_15817/m.38019 type:complete len:221 (-) Transcript_15817:1160-1822(-)
MHIAPLMCIAMHFSSGCGSSVQSIHCLVQTSLSNVVVNLRRRALDVWCSSRRFDAEGILRVAPLLRTGKDVCSGQCRPRKSNGRFAINRNLCVPVACGAAFEAAAFSCPVLGRHITSHRPVIIFSVAHDTFSPVCTRLQPLELYLQPLAPFLLLANSHHPLPFFPKAFLLQLSILGFDIMNVLRHPGVLASYFFHPPHLLQSRFVRQLLELGHEFGYPLL